MAKYKKDDFYKLFEDGASVDEDIFREMRSNILLVAGDHWKSQNEKMHRRIKDSSIDESIKIKLTKNHLGAIQDRKKSAVKALAVGVQPYPYNENDLQDQKDAEIARAVWADGIDKESIKEKIAKWTDSLLDMAECFSKTYFDPNDGDLRGYEQLVYKGQPVFKDPMTGRATLLPFDIITQQPFEPMEDKTKPIFSGRTKVKVIWPMNVIRAVGAETFEESPYIGIKSMMDIEEIKRLVPKDHEDYESIIKLIGETKETTFKVFDCSKGEYLEAKNQAMLRELYFKPCYDYPRGYFAYLFEDKVIVEGELPYGIFPIDWKIDGEIPTSPRGRSRIKRMKPLQVEINRLASQKAYHQIVLGDDKIITQAGSQLSKGQRMDGIRHLIVNGDDVKILNGRAGDQFNQSLNDAIQEIYAIEGLEYQERDSSSQDIMVQLYQSAKQRQKYNPTVEKIEDFLKKVSKKYLEMQKHYLDEHDLIKIAGKKEHLNIAEFKRLEDSGYNIKMMPINDDAESVLGKQLAIQTALQYGGSLAPEQIGKLIKNMPFLNKEAILSNFTINEDMFENDVLALDRGQYRPVRKSDPHDYMLKMLGFRMTQPDYDLKPQQVKALYERKIQEHQTFLTQNAQELKALQDKMIPTSGPLVKVDMYQNVVNDQGQVTQKVQKMSFPMSALLDLAQKMQAQGQFMQFAQNLDAPTQIALLQGGGFGQPTQMELQQQQQQMAQGGQGQVIMSPTQPQLM